MASDGGLRRWWGPSVPVWMGIDELRVKAGQREWLKADFSLQIQVETPCPDGLSEQGKTSPTGARRVYAPAHFKWHMAHGK